MFFLGKIYQRIGRPGVAMRWYKQALEIEPGQPGAAREADGSLYLNLGLS